jgi:hypothetical protein
VVRDSPVNMIALKAAEFEITKLFQCAEKPDAEAG